MTLMEKIIQLRPNLTKDDFGPDKDKIVMEDNSDGKGPYIAHWNHPTETKPTDEELENA